MLNVKIAVIICYMLMSLVFFVTRKCQTIQKNNENCKYSKRKSSYHLKKFEFHKKVTSPYIQKINSWKNHKGLDSS